MREKAQKNLGSLVIFGLLAVVLVLWMVASAFGSGASGAVARVHDSDGGITEISLSQPGRYVVETSLGTNVVEVRDGAVAVVEADCPNADCVDQGAIDAPGRQIICLPHHLWIEVVDDEAASGDDGALDAIGR